MLDLFQEFRILIRRLEGENLDYAVCGGLAMAIHGFIRATIDIVLLQRNLTRSKEILKSLGYLLESEPMKFGKGDTIIHRMTKTEKETGDYLVVDILEVTGKMETIWKNKVSLDWEDGKIQVIDKIGMIQLKRMRNSKVDQEDIEKLESLD